MKKYYNLFFITFFCILVSQPLYSQTYTASNYADIGDTVYLTQSNNLLLDYNLTGTNFTWDFQNLNATSQERIEFKDPTNTGFSFFEWLFIQDQNNTNIASTNNNDINIGPLSANSSNEYYLKTNNNIERTASSFTVSISETPINIKNQYNDPEIIYEFPLSTSSNYTDTGGYITTDLFGVYYLERTVSKTNRVDGNGTLTTPYGTYNNVLRHEAVIVRSDSIAVLGRGIPRVNTINRELTWLDPSVNYPLMIVNQTDVNGTWVTNSVKYYDDEQFFTPKALFTFFPFAPDVNESVQFQNLSRYGSTYLWDFGDPSSQNNTSTLPNPTHIYDTAGQYTITLTVTNGNLKDTVSATIIIGNMRPVAIAQSDIIQGPPPLAVNFTGSNSTDDNGVVFFRWDFNVPFEFSLEENPTYTFQNNGTYNVTLTVLDAQGESDVDTLTILVDDVLGIDIDEEFDIFKLYPNPMDSQTLNISNSENIKTVSLYSMNGQFLGYLELIGNTTELKVNTGIYLLKITDNLDNKTLHKIVKR